MMIFMIRTKKIKTVIWKNVTQSGYDEAIKLREREGENIESNNLSPFLISVIEQRELQWNKYIVE